MTQDMLPTAGDVVRFIALLERHDKRGAITEALKLMDDGMSLSDLVLGVIAPAQLEVGRRWQDGAWTPAQEAVTTDIADTVLAVAASRTPQTGELGRLVVCVAEREHHNLPARMVSELLRAAGFFVVFTGTPRAAPGFGSFLQTFEADALVLSCSLAMNVPGAVPLILTAHRAGIPVIAGGRGFGADELRARRAGADGWAGRIDEVAAVLTRIKESGEPLATPSVDLGQQQELAAIRRQLVDELADRIDYQSGHLLSKGMRSRKRLREDLRNLLLFLEASVLCDERILSEYAEWLQQRLLGRREDPRLVPAILSALEVRLGHDLPAVLPPLRRARGAAQALA